jgi:AcrR family transcriptional regulator
MNDTKHRNHSQHGAARAKRPASALKPIGPAGGGTRGGGTRERILDAAERLFSERGVAAASIRDITRAAGANLAAINYHFGTKQELVAAVFRRRLEPVSERQLELLDEVVRKAGERPPRLEAVLEAMMRPTVEKSLAKGRRNLAFVRLLERSISDPNGEVRCLMRAQMQRVLTLYGAQLARAWPSLPPEEMMWRLLFAMGALHQMLRAVGREGSLPPVMRKSLDAGTMVQRLATFAAAGMKAGA